MLESSPGIAESGVGLWAAEIFPHKAQNSVRWTGPHKVDGLQNLWRGSTVAQPLFPEALGLTHHTHLPSCSFIPQASHTLSSSFTISGKVAPPSVFHPFCKCCFLPPPTAPLGSFSTSPCLFLPAYSLLRPQHYSFAVFPPESCLALAPGLEVPLGNQQMTLCLFHLSFGTATLKSLSMGWER